MNLNLYIVNAFSQQAFAGNPAAVVILKQWLDDALMLRIAMQNNLSETAFALELSLGHYAIRWFSPITEVDFCGHATLATARILFEQQPELSTLCFSTLKVGEIQVSQQADGLLTMSFAKRLPQPLAEPPQALVQGLSIKGQSYGLSPQAYFVFLENEAQVRAIVPDCELLKTLAPYDVVVTAQGERFDFVSRYFWPANGGVEDPVTGSIHAGLAPYWAQKLNKTHLIAHQASERGGELYCRVEQDRVYVAGYSVRYLSGVISL